MWGLSLYLSLKMPNFSRVRKLYLMSQLDNFIKLSRNLRQCEKLIFILYYIGIFLLWDFCKNVMKIFIHCEDIVKHYEFQSIDQSSSFSERSSWCNSWSLKTVSFRPVLECSWSHNNFAYGLLLSTISYCENCYFFQLLCYHWGLSSEYAFLPWDCIQQNLCSTLSLCCIWHFILNR